MHYKACTKYFPVLLCTAKLAQSTSQYYFTLQSLHEVRPSATLHYKACTKSVPVLLCTTKLAQSTSQYYFVLTKLAQSTSQYYFILQSLHKVLPGTTSYYKACTKYFPVLLRTANLAQSTYQYYFVLHAAVTPSNLDAAITMRSADTIELRAMVSEIAAPKPDLDATAKQNAIFKHFLEGILKGKSPSAKSRKSADKSLSQP